MQTIETVPRISLNADLVTIVILDCCAPDSVPVSTIPNTAFIPFIQFPHNNAGDYSLSSHASGIFQANIVYERYLNRLQIDQRASSTAVPGMPPAAFDLFATDGLRY
jgi:hypothetical protein